MKLEMPPQSAPSIENAPNVINGIDKHEAIGHIIDSNPLELKDLDTHHFLHHAIDTTLSFAGIVGVMAVAGYGLNKMVEGFKSKDKNYKKRK